MSKEVKADAAFGQYLLRNVARFIPPPVYRHNPMTTEQKVALKRAYIQQLQREIDRLEAHGYGNMATWEAIHVRLRDQYQGRIEQLTDTMGLRFEMAGNSEIDFMVHTIGMASEDLG